jgi:hydrogenase maturation protease
MKKIGVIGLGNPLRSDDGIGIYILKKLAENKKNLAKNIDFLDGGTGGFNLLHDLSKYDKLIIIDAVDFNKKPGDSLFINIDEIKNKNKNLNILTHESDFLKIINLSKKLKEAPGEIYLYAVQPSDLSYRKDLSELIKEKFDFYIYDLKKKIDKLS